MAVLLAYICLLLFATSASSLNVSPRRSTSVRAGHVAAAAKMGGAEARLARMSSLAKYGEAHQPHTVRRSRSPPRMAHSADELQLAAALVLPLLAYKVAAIAQRQQLQWYLDASIALATASLLVFAAS